MRDPLLLPALSAVTGVAAGSLLAISCAEAQTLAGAAGALWLAAYRWGGGLSRRVCAVVFFAGLGAWHLARQPPTDPPALASGPNPAEIRGCVVEPPVLAGDRARFVVELSPGARVRVNAPAALTAQLRHGDAVAGKARLYRPPEFRNPGSFDYSAWLARRQIYWVASAASSEPWSRASGACGPSLKGALMNLRVALLRRIDAIYPGDGYHAAMMRGLLLGDSAA
jgi:hypothetical protein